jgi:hypothetical protein
VICLLVILLLGLTLTLGGLVHPPPLNTSGTSSSERRVQSVVQVLLEKMIQHELIIRSNHVKRLTYLLGVQTNNERGNVDHLLSDTDVPLPDQNSGVVNRLGETMYASVIRLNPPRNPLADL